MDRVTRSKDVSERIAQQQLQEQHEKLEKTKEFSSVEEKTKELSSVQQQLPSPPQQQDELQQSLESHVMQEEESPVYTSSSEPVVSYSDRQVEQSVKPLQKEMSSPHKDTINAGFVISFDDVSPRKKKPQLSRGKKKSGKKNGEPASDTSSGTATPDLKVEGDIDAPPPPPQFISPMTVSKTESLKASPNSTHAHHQVKHTPVKASEGKLLEHTPTPTVETSPGVAFVFTEAGEEKEQQMVDEEMMKRKQRIMLSALKRKEKQEQKRIHIEMENAKRREEQREKQEEAERKKEEERTRRQLIWDDYMRRKEEAKLAEEGVQPSDTVTPHKPKLKPVRPKSMIHEKQGEKHHRQASPLRPKSMFQEEQVSDKEESNLAHGGKTHRREGSPSQGNGKPTLAQAYEALKDRSSDQMSETSNVSSGDLYTGPKLFVKPSVKSNRTIVINAINHRCLAGSVNKEQKAKVLETLQKSESTHFLVLFRDAGCQFRALYAFDHENDHIVKLHGIGPKVITHKMMNRFFKYESGGKQFVEIHSKHLSATIDALTIQDRFWQNKKTPSSAPPLSRRQ